MYKILIAKPEIYVPQNYFSFITIDIVFTRNEISFLRKEIIYFRVVYISILAFKLVYLVSYVFISVWITNFISYGSPVAILLTKWSALTTNILLLVNKLTVF